MIFHMLILVLIKCSLLRFWGGGGRYRCVASILLDMMWVWSCTLFVISFHMIIDVLISHFETIAFMCRDMLRASVWSVVIGLVS